MPGGTATLRVYNRGAVGYNSQEPYWDQDILAQSFPQYSLSTTSHQGGTWPEMELIPEVGCVRPKLLREPVAQTLAAWTRTGGTWSVVQPPGFPVNVLQQEDGEPDSGEWTATTAANLPANMRFELMVWLWPFPQETTPATYPPYLIIEVSGDYRIYLGQESRRAMFLRKVGADWVYIDEFEWEVIEQPGFLWWDPLAGGLSISTDWGRTRYTYEVTPDVTVTNVTVDAGTVKVYGQGHAALLALNTLKAVDGYCTSFGRPTYRKRRGLWTLDASTWYREEHAACAAAATQVYNANPDEISYRLDLTVKQLVAGSGDNASFIDVYQLPEIYAVTLKSPTIYVAGAWGAGYTEVTGIQTAGMEHTPEVGVTQAQTARLRIPFDADTLTQDYRNVPAELYVDDYRGLGPYRALIGQIIGFGFTQGVQGEWIDCDLFAEFQQALRVKQEKHHPYLGNRTNAAARSAWLELGGWTDANASWVAVAVTFPRGLFSEPFLAPREGLPILELLRRIDRASGCFSYYDVLDGRWESLLLSAVYTAGSVLTLYPTSAAAVAGGGSEWDTWKTCSVQDRGAEIVTRWKATGQTPSGAYFAQRATDWAQESDPTRSDFTARPYLELLDGEWCDPTNAASAALAASGQNYDWRDVLIETVGHTNYRSPCWVYVSGHKRLGASDPVRILGIEHRLDRGEATTIWQGACVAAL